MNKGTYIFNCSINDTNFNLNFNKGNAINNFKKTKNMA